MQEVIAPSLARPLVDRPERSAAVPARADDSLKAVLRVSVIAVAVGGGLQGYANSTVAAVAVALVFLIVGYLLTTVTFAGKRPEIRAFLFMYTLSILAGGLAQCYSLYVFSDPQNFSDSVYFLGQISPKPPFKVWAELPTDTSLAIATWQALYAVAWYLGIKFGPYIAVMFNAMLMGWSGALTVATARALFPEGSTRMLQRVALLFATCGLFILFGSVLLRDAFVVFFNAIWLWAVVGWLANPTARKMVILAVATIVTIFALFFLRDELVRLFAVFMFLAGLAWYCTSKLNAVRVLVVVFILAVLPIVDSYLIGLWQDFRETQTTGQQNYSNLGAVETSGNTLGTRLVAEQPLPIQMAMGAGTLLVNPIPLWANFKADASDYHIIGGYQGFYLVLVIPLGVAGLIIVIQLLTAHGRKAIPLVFMAFYMLLNIAAVTASSRLPRHLGQFLAAFTIVAALPDLNDKKQRKTLRMISIAWFATVVLIHAAWAVMR